MSWYFIDAGGVTQGPVQESVITNKYSSKEINDQSYVWNGTTVNQWSLIKDVPFLHQKLNKSKPAPPRPAATAKPAVKKKPKPSGGMGGLLASIRAGKALKKVEKPKLAEPGKPAPKKAGGKMTLQEQLAARLKGGSKKTKPQPKKAQPASKPSWQTKKKVEPAKKWGNNNTKAKEPAKKWGNNNKSSSSGNSGKSSGKTPSKFDIKKKIDGCNEDWKLKAIAKILD